MGWRWLLTVFGLALAWHALRGVAWAEVLGLLAGLGTFVPLLMLSISLLMLPLMTARWWLLLRTLGSPLGLPTVSGYRMAANAICYLTPGPQIGGEPLLVYLLHRRHGIELTTATMSVALDRLLEFLATIVVLLLCLSTLAFTKSIPFAGGQTFFTILAVLALLAAVLASLFTGRKPFSRLVSLLMSFTSRDMLPPSANHVSVSDAIVRVEVLAERLFRQHRNQVLIANLLSLCHWLGVFAEFWVMAALLGYPLSPAHLIAVVFTARLAFLTPLPAGIGVLESALPWITASLGLGSAIGLSLCLIIRCRDLLFSLIGLVLATKYVTIPLVP